MTAEVALVVGGAGGIGEAIVRRLAAGAGKVVVADRDRDRGAAVADAAGGLFVPVDAGIPEHSERAVSVALQEFGRVDTLVFAAGAAGRCGLDGFTAWQYRETMRTNLDGAVYAIQAVLAPMRRQGGGSVLVTSSLAGLTGSPDVFYAAAKHALVGLVRSAASLLAADHIRINALCPGLVDTPLLAGLRRSLLDHGLRLADPDEIATAAETVLADPGSGRAWLVQAGRPAEPVPPPDIPLAPEP
ncbi:SDR family oxidoreductase [Amycolatopsis ultiminotia]|uniref:SDR family oxidoreductase n=1 Tax=Amycolatopsis ultiminotia TaxID=543629 RepID=A0ABP6V1Z2_9PSEU